MRILEGCGGWEGRSIENCNLKRQCKIKKKNTITVRNKRRGRRCLRSADQTQISRVVMAGLSVLLWGLLFLRTLRISSLK